MEITDKQKQVYYYHNKEERKLIKYFCKRLEIKCVKTDYRYFEIELTGQKNYELKRLIAAYKIERLRVIRASLGDFIQKVFRENKAQ